MLFLLWCLYFKRTYFTSPPFLLSLPLGHSKAVRDICFNTAGTQFLSAAYDRYLKLWDTETGKKELTYTNIYLPYKLVFLNETM